MVTLIVELVSSQDVPITISNDMRNLDVTVGLTEESPTLDGVTIRMRYSPTSKILEITPQGPANGLLYIQLVNNVTDLNGTKSVYTEAYPIILNSSLSTDFRYVFVPKSMSIRDESGNKVASVYISATQRKDLYAEVDDYLSDGYPDNDYSVYPVTSTTLNMAPIVNSESEADLVGTSTIPTLVGLTPDLPTMLIPPRTIARVTITAMNPGGDQSSNYQPVYTNFTYQITFGGTTNNGVSLSSILPNAGVIQTPPVSVVVLAKDDATGTFDDAGGTCNLLGLGTLALLVPVALTRKKRKK
jgi:hypothetical protein